MPATSHIAHHPARVLLGSLIQIQGQCYPNMICQRVTELAQRQLVGAEALGRAIVFSEKATAQATEDAVAELETFRCDKHRSVSDARDRKSVV